jgi:hypothetical protein
MSTQNRSRAAARALVAAGLSIFAYPAFVSAGGHFDSYVDPNYNSQIYAGPIGSEAVGAWTLSGHLLTRGSNYINEWDPTNTSVHQGTSVHNLIATHNVPNLAPGVGITNGTDGYLYTLSSAGIQRIDPTTWGPAVNMPNSIGNNGAYSINTLPNGKIVYSDNAAASNIYVYDPVTQVNTFLYGANTLVDDIETGPGGEIALAGQGNSSIIIINSSGGLIKSFSTARYPDGLAFGDGPFGNSVYANNNDGSITRYDFGSPGYTGTVTAVDIALTLPNHHGYGDLATVGPDCAFYIGTFDNPGFTAHGNTAGIGTNWDNGVSNNENSVVRIGFNDLTGGVGGQCAFYSLVETFIPEPSGAMLMFASIVPILARRRRAGVTRICGTRVGTERIDKANP